MPGSQQRRPLRLLGRCLWQSERDPKRMNCSAPTWEASCPWHHSMVWGIHWADSPNGKLVFWLCLHRIFTVWLLYAKMNVERLLPLKTNGVGHCSVLEKERVKKGRESRWASRPSGSEGHVWEYQLDVQLPRKLCHMDKKRRPRRDSTAHRETYDGLEATRCSCYHSVSCYPQDTRPPNLHMHLPDVFAQEYKTYLTCNKHISVLFALPSSSALLPKLALLLVFTPPLESSCFYNPRTFV